MTCKFLDILRHFISIIIISSSVVGDDGTELLREGQSTMTLEIFFKCQFPTPESRECHSYGRSRAAEGREEGSCGQCPDPEMKVSV